jgi:prepilin-type N-terminal cleavage/methylation domain-containing protein
MIPTHQNKSGFTLIELMLAMTVFAIIMTSVLLAVENMSIARIKTENRIKLLEELYFFSEQLVGNIKEGGTIDYEEYWNRQSVGTIILSGAISGTSIWGSYSGATWVGNYGYGGSLGTTTYGDGLYYCVSGSGSRMGTGGCLSTFNTPSQNYSGSYQRYGEYLLQYTDYNGNADGDAGDEDGNGSIIDDEDDKEIGNGPTVLSGSTPELYLINPIDKTRAYFRYIVRQDPGTATGCVITAWVPEEGCMGNVQILRMQGLDIGYGHSGVTSDTWAFDGKIDTWMLHPDWTGTGPTIPGGWLATGHESEWVDLFPNSINVKKLEFTLYPLKDPWLSWDARDCGGTAGCISPFIHPYVRLQMNVGFSWGKRRALKWDDPTISVNTTITLADRE